jgi:hypothetical protein
MAQNHDPSGFAAWPRRSTTIPVPTGRSNKVVSKLPCCEHLASPPSFLDAAGFGPLGVGVVDCPSTRANRENVHEHEASSYCGVRGRASE